jgi:hypothetical protein
VATLFITFIFVGATYFLVKHIIFIKGIFTLNYIKVKYILFFLPYKMSRFTLRTSMQDLTELIVHTGYEERLISGVKNSEDVKLKWFTTDEDGDLYTTMTPLLAGNRIIYPEELDPALAKALSISKKVDWGAYTRKVSKKAKSAEVEDIFNNFEGKKEDAVNVADTNLLTRLSLIEEVKNIMKDSEELKYIFESGLLLRLNKAAKPLNILQWLEEQNYFSGASALDIIDISFIHEGEHKIMIVRLDAESG